MHFASKMANDYSCDVFLILYNQHLCYVCFNTLCPQTYRDEVAVGVCNETCFIFFFHLVPEITRNSMNPNAACSNFPSVV